MPLRFRQGTAAGGYPLCRATASMPHEAGALALASDNGDPTAPIPIARLRDGQTGSPLDRSGALSGAASYLTDLFVSPRPCPTRKRT